MEWKRYDIINALIKRYNLKMYLEIGIQHADNCFNKIECDFKQGADPCALTVPVVNNNVWFHECTSDQYFESMNRQKKQGNFDITFIDGLHEIRQVITDIHNCLCHLSKGGFIVVHDCNPSSEAMQRVPRETKEWTGDVWKAIVLFRSFPGLRVHVVDTDYGCGIISVGKQDIIIVKNPSYDDLVENRKQWLNLLTVEEFKKEYDLV